MTNQKKKCIKCYVKLKENEKNLCSECIAKLSKACKSNGRAVVFIIDAAWGEYSKRIDVENGKLFYIESKARPIPNAPPFACVWDEIIIKREEISYAKAYSFAKSSKQQYLLKQAMRLMFGNSYLLKVMLLFLLKYFS